MSEEKTDIKKDKKKKGQRGGDAQQAEEIILSAEQFEELREKIEQLQKEREEYLSTAQRLQAEFDNFRKRNAGVRAESMEEGARDVVKELLPVLDNLDRAIDSLDEDAKKDGFAQGVLMVQKQFVDTLGKLGLETIDTDCAFDPEWHDAVSMVESEDAEEGAIANVIQKGYKFKGKAVRCSMVQVAK